MSTYQPTKTFLLHAEEGRVDVEGGREIGIRTASKLSRTAYLTPYYYQWEPTTLRMVAFAKAHAAFTADLLPSPRLGRRGYYGGTLEGLQ